MSEIATNSKTKVLLVDDHKLVRYGFRKLLEMDKSNQFEIVGEANTGDDALQFIRNNPIDLILLDINMPGLCGLEAANRICRLNKNIKVLVMTGMPDEVFAKRALKAGADGFIHKGIEVDELIKAIKTVISGEKYISDSIANKLVLAKMGEETAPQEPFDSLSNRELEFFLMIASQGIKDPQISHLINRSVKTVNGYRYGVLEKLGTDSIIKVLRLAVSYGLIDPEEAVIR